MNWSSNGKCFDPLSSLRASSLRRSGGEARKGRRAPYYVSGIWIPPLIPLWLPFDWAVRFLPISAKRKRARMWTNIEKHVPRVMTSLLMSSPPISFFTRLFRCRYSNSRDVVASSPSFFRPAARAPRRACSQAIFIKLFKQFIKWLYGVQCGEFVCGYWGLNGKTVTVACVVFRSKAVISLSSTVTISPSTFDIKGNPTCNETNDGNVKFETLWWVLHVSWPVDT